MISKAITREAPDLIVVKDRSPDRNLGQSPDQHRDRDRDQERSRIRSPDQRRDRSRNRVRSREDDLGVGNIAEAKVDLILGNVTEDPNQNLNHYRERDPVRVDQDQGKSFDREVVLDLVAVLLEIDTIDVDVT